MVGKLVVQVVDKPGYSGNCKATVLCIMYRNIVTPLAAGPVKDELVQLLRYDQSFDVEVDIVGIENCFRPYLFAISAGAVTRYEECRFSMIAMLKSTFHEKWTTMSLYEADSDKVRAMPTILVTVQPYTTHNWHRLLLELMDLQQTTHRLPVEFLPGELCHLTGNSQFTSMRKAGYPQLGDFITVAGECGGGTLGLFTILKYGDKKHTGFLTNFHVVSPAELAKIETKAKAYLCGSLSLDDHTRREVIRFAPKDIEETVIDRLGQLEEPNAELLKLRQGKYHREMAVDELPHHHASRIGRYEAFATLHQKQIDRAMPMPITIGKVLSLAETRFGITG